MFGSTVSVWNLVHRYVILFGSIWVGISTIVHGASSDLVTWKGLPDQNTLWRAGDTVTIQYKFTRPLPKPMQYDLFMDGFWMRQRRFKNALISSSVDSEGFYTATVKIPDDLWTSDDYVFKLRPRRWIFHGRSIVSPKFQIVSMNEDAGKSEKPDSDSDDDDKKDESKNATSAPRIPSSVSTVAVSTSVSQHPTPNTQVLSSVPKNEQPPTKPVTETPKEKSSDDDDDNDDAEDDTHEGDSTPVLTANPLLPPQSPDTPDSQSKPSGGNFFSSWGN